MRPLDQEPKLEPVVKGPADDDIVRRIATEAAARRAAAMQSNGSSRFRWLRKVFSRSSR